MSNESNPMPGDTVYRSYAAQTLDTDRGFRVYVRTCRGKVSPCGGWVDCGESRYRMSESWRLLAVDAKADSAAEFERLAGLLVAQAAELRRRAEA